MFPASGNFTTTWGSGATASNTILGFASAPTTGDLIDCVTATTTCTLTDSGVLAANVLTTASNVPINHVVSATGAITTIADGNNPLVINCALTSGTTCLTTGETTAATTAGAVEYQITTLNTSTAIPLQVTQGAGVNATNTPLALNVAGGTGGVAAATGGGFTGGPITLTSGAGSAAGATSGAGGTGGAINLIASIGGAGSATTGNGGVGGGIVLTTGAGGAKGGNTANAGGAGGGLTATLGNGATGGLTGAGGAGGPALITSGTGGNAGATSGTGGAGGNISLTAGPGGTAAVGSTTGAGGNIVLTPGAAGGTGTAGLIGVVQVAGANAGFVYLAQGAANTTANTNIPANSIIDQAPTAVTAYANTRPGVSANGIITNNVSAAVETQGFSGDGNHSVVISFVASQTVGATSLCSTTFCPAGTYVIDIFVDVTTACTSTGTLVPWVGWTDDAGAKGAVGTTFFGNGFGTGFVATTGTLTVTSTTDYMQGSYIVRSTGAAAINYGYTSSACGSGSLAGKMYLSVYPVQ
jgi:hypothetical protein